MKKIALVLSLVSFVTLLVQSTFAAAPLRPLDRPAIKTKPASPALVPIRPLPSR